MTNITMTPVESSQIAAIGYDEASETMRVTFKSWKGETTSSYDYFKVPADVHQRFMACDSKGRFLGAEIKGRFEFQKLAPPAEATAAE